MQFNQQNQYLDDLIVKVKQPYIDATINMDPDVLNLSSKGKSITCYIELPEFDVSQVDLTSIVLNGIVLAELKPTSIDDSNEDGNPELMVKFDRQQVISFLYGLDPQDEDTVELEITGKLNDGTAFKGKDLIKINVK